MMNNLRKIWHFVDKHVPIKGNEKNYSLAKFEESQSEKFKGYLIYKDVEFFATLFTSMLQIVVCHLFMA